MKERGRFCPFRRRIENLALPESRRFGGFVFFGALLLKTLLRTVKILKNPTPECRLVVTQAAKSPWRLPVEKVPWPHFS
jgi:hypothetical protein